MDATRQIERGAGAETWRRGAGPPVISVTPACQRMARGQRAGPGE